MGFVGLVAAHLGAAEVVQTDYHPDCLELCRQNAHQNNIANVTIRSGDWRDWPQELTGFDLVIGTDILYERTLHPTLTALLPTLGKTVLLADPIRPAALGVYRAPQKRRLDHLHGATTRAVGRRRKRHDVALDRTATLMRYNVRVRGAGSAAGHIFEVCMKKKILVLGSGPIRIGQGIEFDYCTVHCVWALREAGYEAIVLNNNPETVSTDFDTSDKLYFEPLTGRRCPQCD